MSPQNQTGFDVSSMTAILKSIQDKHDKKVDEAIAVAAEHVKGVAQQRAPIDEGTLRRSARVKRGKKQASVSFNTPYARRQHEDMSLHHTEGQAKYLESAFNDTKDDVKRILAKELKI